MQSLPQKLEAACAALVTAAGVSVDVTRQGETTTVPLSVFTGLDDEEKAVPSVVIAALSGQEFPQDSGNFTLNVVVEVRTNAGETDLPAHRRACEDALGPLVSDDTATQLSAQEEDGNPIEVGVLGISNRASRERVEERCFVTELTFDAYCVGVVLA